MASVSTCEYVSLVVMITNFDLDRARQPTMLPLLRPLKLTTGEVVNSIPVARNQGVIVGIAASGRDEETWGSEGAGAMEWKPERWLDAKGAGGEDDRNEEELGLTGGGEEMKGLRVAKARLPAAYSGMCVYSIMFIL